MNCGKIREDLQDYLDAEVTPQEKTEIEEHLASCPDCRKDLAELRQTRQLLENLDEVEPPAWLTQRVMARVRAEAPAKEGLWARLVGWIRWIPARLPAAAVASLVIAVTAVVLIKSMEPKIQETMPTITTLQPPAPVQKDLAQQTEREKAGKEKVGGIVDAARNATAPVHQESRQKTPAPKPMSDNKPSPSVNLSPPEVTLQGSHMDSARTMKKSFHSGETAADERMAGSQEHVAQSPQPVPAAPAASPAPRPKRETAPALPEQGAARGGTVFKDSSQAAEQVRPPSKAREERAQGSLLQNHLVVAERYSNGNPRLVITYQNAAGKSVKIMEERFDEQGRRHGLHRSYAHSGNLTAEVVYEHGEPVSIREFNADGTPRTGISGKNWPWLGRD